jgi:hypothetical protein
MLCYTFIIIEVRAWPVASWNSRYMADSQYIRNFLYRPEL